MQLLRLDNKEKKSCLLLIIYIGGMLLGPLFHKVVETVFRYMHFQFNVLNNYIHQVRENMRTEGYTMYKQTGISFCCRRVKGFRKIEIHQVMVALRLCCLDEVL